MSKEAMKLAKEWFERNTYGDEAVDVYDALCEALAEQPAQQALDKMAENARELGLDYEPAQQKESMRPYRQLQDNGSKYFGESWDKAEQPAQQEPVAGCACRWNSEGDRVVTCERHQGWLEVIAEWADRARDAEKKLKALNTSPPPQRKPLTDEQIEAIHQSTWIQSTATLNDFARAIEAAHGIKENT